MQDVIIGRVKTGSGGSAIRRVFAGLMAFFLTAPIWPPAMDSTEAAARPPEIHADADTHRFPAVYKGETLSHAFRIANRGGKDLHIERVESS